MVKCLGNLRSGSIDRKRNTLECFNLSFLTNCWFLGWSESCNVVIYFIFLTLSIFMIERGEKEVQPIQKCNLAWIAFKLRLHQSALRYVSLWGTKYSTLNSHRHPVPITRLRGTHCSKVLIIHAEMHVSLSYNCDPLIVAIVWWGRASIWREAPVCAAFWLARVVPRR